MWRAAIVTAAVLALAGAAAGCSSSKPNTHGRIPIVAAENFWGDIASQIGGSRVQVTSIITDPSADPHLYESDARDAEAIASARVVIENGLGYDDFVRKLLGTTSGDGRTVITAADVPPAVPRDANPHLWYDLARVRAVAREIAGVLNVVQPAHTREFAANELRFERGLDPITGVLAVIRERFVHAPVAYTERVPEYLLVAAGLDVATPPGFARAIEDGNEPSAADAQRMRTLLSRHQIRVLIYNAQANSAVTRNVRRDATEAGIPVIAVTETMPRGAHSYQAWQLGQAGALLHALERSRTR